MTLKPEYAFMVALACFATGMVGVVNADTVYLKKGSVMEGIIDKEDKDSVELNIGTGTVTIRREYIKDIHISPPEERAKVNRDLQIKTEQAKAREGQYLEDRERRFKEYAQWSQEMTKERAKEERNEKEVPIKRDVETNSVLVETMLNGEVKATLVIDTGASIILLSKKKGEELGLDLADTKDIMELRLAGNRRVNGKAMVLKSIRLQDIEEKDVPAVVLLEDEGNLGLKDGLLGRSFLDRFSVSVDLKNMRMILEKLK